MLRSFALRLALPAVLAVTLVPAAVYAQSESSQSVAEAARRAREQKKAATKPVKVVTEDDVKPASTDGAGAAAQPAAAAQPTGAQAPVNPADAEKATKERAALKQQIKQAMSDLDVLQREYQLDQDSYFSKPDYAKDTAGKEKLDAQKQQVSEKQQELDRLKAQLAALPDSPDSPATAPPKP